MSTVDKIANWVRQKPVILIRFNEEFSEVLYNPKHGFEHLTIVKPHPTLEGLNLPTVCLLETQNQGVTKCYLATVIYKTVVSSFDSRLTIKKLRSVKPSSLQKILGKITNNDMKCWLREHNLAKDTFFILSPKLSKNLVRKLADNPDNNTALEVALSMLFESRNEHNNNWAQQDAIMLCLDIFGIRSKKRPHKIIPKHVKPPSPKVSESYLHEDNVVHRDALKLPGFDYISHDVTGRAIFKKKNEQLIIYTANKLPLERMLGIDLIYINQTRGNIVMIQYKMLEEGEQDRSTQDWLFRPDKQLYKQIARMQLPPSEVASTDYRLNSNPFFFKFVKRRRMNKEHQSFLVSLDHLKQILNAPKSRGPRGGRVLSYRALDGTYLRRAGMISLIRSGYIGTHRIETEYLAKIIAEAAAGNKAIVYAWQKYLEKKSQSGS